MSIVRLTLFMAKETLATMNTAVLLLNSDAINCQQTPNLLCPSLCKIGKQSDNCDSTEMSQRHYQGNMRIALVSYTPMLNTPCAHTFARRAAVSFRNLVLCTLRK